MSTKKSSASTQWGGGEPATSDVRIIKIEREFKECLRLCVKILGGPTEVIYSSQASIQAESTKMT